MTAREMEQRVQDFCDSLNVRWDKLPPEPESAFSSRATPGWITAPVPTNSMLYLICLHELGHTALGHTNPNNPQNFRVRRTPKLQIKYEFDAWLWALNEYEGEVGSIERQVIMYSINTYVESWYGITLTFDQVFKECNR